MRRLAIVGGGRGFNDMITPDRDVWTIQSVYDLTKRADVVFRLHSHKDSNPIAPDVDVITLDMLPTTILRKNYGNYFHSSIAWMFGYAVACRYTYIELHGVDMATHGEYGYQRDGLSRLIGKAEAYGVEVIIPRASQMYLPPALYGMSKEVQDAIQEQETRRLHENQ